MAHIAVGILQEKSTGDFFSFFHRLFYVVPAVCFRGDCTRNIFVFILNNYRIVRLVCTRKYNLLILFNRVLQ